MFDLGKDLSRYIAQGVGGAPRDVDILELLPAEALAEQALREQRTAQASAAWRDVARLWAVHARRSGDEASGRHALRSGQQALETARGDEQRRAAMAACGEALLARWDMFGESRALREAAALGRTLAAAGDALLPARTALREARRNGDPDGLRRAATELHGALAADIARGTARDPWRKSDRLEARLEHAAALAELGLEMRDPMRLDQSGREVCDLIAATDGDRRPLTRARALAACGASLAALGEMAGRRDRIEEALDLLDAATDLFTPDHSPMDAAALVAAQAAALFRLADDAETLKRAGARSLKARRMTPAGTSLRTAIEILSNRLRIRAAQGSGATFALKSMETNLKEALTLAGSKCDPAAWAVDQLALAGVYEALQTLGGPDRAEAAALARSHAREILRETGVAA